ncbi:hypothetical protein NW762_009507 [Fusarium torreyae]|uniref:Uncharacterized protein n=1 Tax=Fusarium torreyae TaxID=1237075 RepID=A0A9W8VCD8_9HYPO|nr:hypothetical protein NW762_009507 [Fusarium torreyae]
MSSWETTALRLQGNASAGSTPSTLHKSLPPLPKQTTRRNVTHVKETASEDEFTGKKGWKPLSLSTPILLAVIVLTILLAVAIETIAQRSATQGGLALSPTLDDMPSYAKFSYLYVPTIIAVLYSMIWSWIDLDVKRMQPWFELSKPDGATAEDSLFLDYQYEFVALVPFKAAKRKHWPVFFGGTAMVIVFWALTPLQSTLFGTGIIQQTEMTTLMNRSQLLPVSQHETVLDAQFLNTGYAIAWLGQQLPPFTTSKYALLPFYSEKSAEIANLQPNATVESTVSAETTKMWTELYCWPAEISRVQPRSRQMFSFLNGQGCNTTWGLASYSKRKMLYFGHYSSPYSDYWIAGPNCPSTPNSTHQFLAIWTKDIPVDWSPYPLFNISALFCQPYYYKQKVLATVRAGTHEPINDTIEELAPRETLSEKEFNSTAFEFLLGNGMAQNPIVRDWPFNKVVEQHPRLNYTGLDFPLPNMVGFALAGRNNSMDDYVHHSILQEAYQNAHQYLFSVAVTNLLGNSTEISNDTASIKYYKAGVIVSRTFATALESLLAIVAVFTAIVLWFCWKAPSKLPVNPSSIGRYIDFFSNSPELLRAFQPLDYADDKVLKEEFQMDIFQLTSNGHSDQAKLFMHPTLHESTIHGDTTVQKRYYDPVRPLALQKWVGVLFVAALMGAMVFLSYLKDQEARLNGLIRPSENFEVLQILENYIPTIFATLIEPLWVLLNRLLCVLQPFKDLWEGKSKASNSIDTTYTSIPPQLVFWRAIKSKHFVLVLVCTMALLANLLAVGLGSLFNENIMTANYPVTMLPAFAPRFDNATVSDMWSYLTQDVKTTNVYEDHMYVAMANITAGTALPPWITQEYYFQRYERDNSSEHKTGDTFTVNTRGFGAIANCTPVPALKLPVYPDVGFVWPTKEMNLSQCATIDDFIELIGPQMRQAEGNRSSGISAVEYCQTLDHTFGSAPCGRTLPLGWGRTKTAEKVNSTVEASFLICRPIFETAMFNVTIDPLGHVLSYERTSDLETTLDYADADDHIDEVFENYNWNYSKDPEWHNDTTSRDWMNHLLMVSTGSKSVLDPASPVPDSEDLKPEVSNIYRRGFAILLGLNEQLFESSYKESSVTAVRHTKETRIFMEQASFIITMTVLSMNTIVAILFYVRAVAFVLPRMPTTLGAIIAYVASSRFVTQAYREAPGHANRTLSFGRYVGSDGDVHIGIEADPHVVPIDPLSLGPQNAVSKFFRKRRLRSTDKFIRADTWL